MVRGWYLKDGEITDRAAPNMANSGDILDANQLHEQTGIEHFTVNVDDIQNDSVLRGIRKERGYTYEDTITVDKNFSPETMENFFREHLHADEEIRLVLDGDAYFDARNHGNQWIRIEVTRGDLLILPAGIYHRFTPTHQCYIKANRYFQDEPVWTAYNRSDEQTEMLASRQRYLTTMAKS